MQIDKEGLLEIARAKRAHADLIEAYRNNPITRKYLKIRDYVADVNEEDEYIELTVKEVKATLKHFKNQPPAAPGSEEYIMKQQAKQYAEEVAQNIERLERAYAESLVVKPAPVQKA